MRRSYRRATVLGVLFAANVACAGAAVRSAADASPRPVIVSIAPVEGPAGVAYPIQVAVVGRNFADSANTVRFGMVSVAGVRSADGGTRLTFLAPKESPSTGEVPPAPLLPGRYRITVSTAAGTSNVVEFVLTREPEEHP